MEINKFYVAGKFITPDGKEIIDLINPATEEKVGHVVSGSVKDVDDAVSAAKQAFQAAYPRIAHKQVEQNPKPH